MTSPSEPEGVQTSPTEGSAHVAQHPAEADAHGHGHATADEGPHFSDQEWKELQDDDIHAAAAIVGLMASIFCIGLMLYSTIALVIAT